MGGKITLNHKKFFFIMLAFSFAITANMPNITIETKDIFNINFLDKLKCLHVELNENIPQNE